MANSAQNPNRTSLAGRVAAEKRTAAETRQLKMRVASAYTLAKTMLPTGSAEQHVKVAKTLLALSTPVLGAMLRTAAVNAHFTRVAEEFKNVHKVDMNDLLEDPSLLNKEKKAVESELKGDPKNASAKVADDRADCGPQPSTYDEGKRTEPAGMDASDVHEPEQKIWTEGGEGKVPVGKEAGKKKACGDECKGCDGCKKEASEKKAADAVDPLNGDGCNDDPDCKRDHEHKKEAAKKKETPVERLRRELKEALEEEKKEKGKKKDAAAKTAEEGEEAPPPPPDADADAAGDVESAEGDAEAAADEHEGEAAEAGAEGEADAEAGDTEGAEDAEDEVFDEEEATLQDAIEDVKDDIDTLTDAIEEELGDADEINLAEEAEGDGAFDEALADGAAEGGLAEGGEGAVDVPEELNIENIFSDDNFADKVSALNDEEDGYFDPSDASELEGILDQEEAIGSPADMFIVEDTEDDPLARIFASEKTAGSGDGIVEWGEMQGHFESDHGNDTRDNDSDHEDDILTEVAKKLKPEPDGQTRDKQDATNDLKEPKQAGAKKVRRVAGKKAAKPGKDFPKLATHFDPMAQAAKIAGGNLAALVFPDEADFA